MGAMRNDHLLHEIYAGLNRYILRIIVRDFAMKRSLSIALCLFLLLSCAIPALAANDVPEEVMEATKSVVRILSQYYNGAATGSGFVIKNEPGEVLIATNNHVVEGNPTSISVWVAEDELVEAEIVFTTAKKELAVFIL